MEMQIIPYVMLLTNNSMKCCWTIHSLSPSSALYLYVP